MMMQTESREFLRGKELSRTSGQYLASESSILQASALSRSEHYRDWVGHFQEEGWVETHFGSLGVLIAAAVTEYRA